jgi:competence protein ComEA
MVRRFAAWSVVVSLVAVSAVPALAQQSPNPSPKPPSRAEAKADAVVNLNTASAADLESLPGIGKSTAQRIVEYRQKSGGFKKIEELMNVKGIGEKSFLKIKSRLTVAAPKA